ncbi:MAG: hypothetical protein IKE27_09160 [Oscillospiraceae bacterium]|nr:hypothetical protein [Oscillospiraceae bacterium]
MAEKKKVERQFVRASDGKALGPKAPKTAAKSSTAALDRGDVLPKEERVKKARPKRILAIVFWVLALACEVFAILILSKKMYVGENPMIFFWILLAVDFVFVVIGSQFWKKGNDIDPASQKNKFKFFLQNQLGVIVSLIAFVPLIILVLINKDMDKKTKTIATVVAIIALLIAGVSSVDFNPASQEELEAAGEVFSNEAVYWTRFGTVYHLDPDCQAIKNSAVIFSGTVEEAFEANRNRPCSFCVDYETQSALDDALEDILGD